MVEMKDKRYQKIHDGLHAAAIALREISKEIEKLSESLHNLDENQRRIDEY